MLVFKRIWVQLICLCLLLRMIDMEQIFKGINKPKNNLFGCIIPLQFTRVNTICWGRKLVFFCLIPNSISNIQINTSLTMRQKQYCIISTFLEGKRTVLEIEGI